MTTEQEIQVLRDYWRAFVGRLPHAVAKDFQRLAGLRGPGRLQGAIDVVCEARLRRTKDRLRLFYAYFGESVPTRAP